MGGWECGWTGEMRGWGMDGWMDGRTAGRVDVGRRDARMVGRVVGRVYVGRSSVEESGMR